MRSVIKCPYYYFDSAITDEFCDLIISMGKEKIQEEASVIASKTAMFSLAKSYRRGKVAWIEDTWVEAMMGAYVQQANQYAEWDFILEDKERVQFATYKKQDFYDYHRDCDIVNPLFRKLSVTVQLSDPETYKGGELLIKHYWGKKVLPMDKEVKNRGTVIVFPSMLLHTITPVIKGKRHSLVQWYNGPDFV